MRNVPPVVKNLIILNVVLFIGTWVAGYLTQDENFLVRYLGLHYWKSEYFMPVQVITHMFMHGGLTHIFFNMFALWMFGSVLEQVWGARRFFIFYMVTGLGAATLHLLVIHLQYMNIINHVTEFLTTQPDAGGMSVLVQRFWPQYYQDIYTDLIKAWNADPANPVYIGQAKEFIALLLESTRNIPTVGASGAVFGLLLGFGMLFPNTQLMLLFPPIPIKAKYMVIGYGALELVLAVTQPGSNIAHFAHLGGMLFGFIMIRMWRTNRGNFY